MNLWVIRILDCHISMRISLTLLYIIDCPDLSYRFKRSPHHVSPISTKPTHTSGMLLCASDKDHKTVEVLTVAEGSKPGERITSDMFTQAPDAQLPPKKKIFEKVQSDLTTNDSLEVTYKGELLRTSAGPILAPSLVNAAIR